MRHTSPLEINQQKFVYKLDVPQRHITAYPIRYNPYLQLPYPTTPLQKIDIDTLIQQNTRRIQEQLTAGNRHITTTSREDHNLTHATITITTTEKTVQSLPDAFDAKLLKKI